MEGFTQSMQYVMFLAPLLLRVVLCSRVGPCSHLSILAAGQQAYKAWSLLHYPKAEPVQRKGLG